MVIVWGGDGEGSGIGDGVGLGEGLDVGDERCADGVGALCHTCIP